MSSNDTPRLQPGRRLKISKAFLFGLSSSPFKIVLGPKERYRNRIVGETYHAQVIEKRQIPGVLREWIASDGRRGALDSPAHSLTAANLKKLPKVKLEEKIASAAKAERDANGEKSSKRRKSRRVAGATTPAMAGGGIDARGLKGALQDVQNEQAKKGVNFTTKEDAKLTRMKNEGASWAEIADELGKEKSTIQQRWNQIKPADWVAPQGKSKKKAGGVQLQGANQQQGEAWQQVGGTKNKNGEFVGQAVPNAPPQPGQNNVYGAPNVAVPYAHTNPYVNYAQQPCYNNLYQPAYPPQYYQGGGFGGYGAAHKNMPNVVPPAPPARDPDFVDIYPDENFTMDELMLIAKILQEDQQRVWIRMASRFYDRTGRRVDKDVFEQKLTGKVQKSVRDV